MHHRHVALSCCTFNLSLYSKIKTWNIRERLLMMRKSLYFTHNQITRKWNNKIEFLWTLVNVKWKKLFVHFFMHFLCTLPVTYFEPFLGEKCFFQVKIEFRADRNYIKDMQINGESSVVVRDKKFHVEIRVLLMTCLFDLF